MTTTDKLAAITDWYENRHELRPYMIFRTHDGYVMLDGSVPGDATKWRVLDWYEGAWFHEDGTIEPGDLLELVGEDELPRRTA